MSNFSRRARTIATSIAVSAATFVSGGTHAAPLDIADVPLFLTSGVQPNLIMAIDDSGSMDFEVLLPGNDGSAWWRVGNKSGNCAAATGNSFTGCKANGTTDIEEAGTLNFNNKGEHTGMDNINNTWKKYAYLFPNGGNGANTSYQRRLGDNTNDHYSIPPLPAYAWARSSDHNAAYFNPATVYAPWPDEGGYTFDDSPPSAARFDPVFGDATNAINLTTDFAGMGSTTASTCDNTSLPGVAGNYYFRVFTGMTIPAGTCMRQSSRNWEVVRAAGCVVGTNNACFTSETVATVPMDRQFTLGSNSSVAIRYFPATFYTNDTLPTGYGYTGTTLSGLAPDGTTLRGYEIKETNFESKAKYDAAIQNFANWFTYYRKRHQALRGGLAQAFNDINGMRVAGFTINNRQDVTMGDIDVAANRTALYSQFYYDWVRSGGTPNRDAVARIVSNYKRTNTGAPIEHSCQRNFGMLFTDGFSNAPVAGDGFGAVGNIDGGTGAPYEDDTSNTMADGVMDAYLNPLRTASDFERGKVKVAAACEGANPDPRLDCNRDLHMNFYAVTLGTRGLLFNPDADPEVDPYVDNPAWPATFPTRHPSAVDDLWHAAINGRGKLLNAKNSSEIAEKLSAVLTNMSEETASASAASVNSGSISSTTRVYQARFDSSSWTGQLLSYPIVTTGPNTGSLGNLEWDAGKLIPAADDREIITVNSTGTKAAGSKVAFTWDALDDSRKAQIEPTFATDETLAQNVIDYLRGDDANEVRLGGAFRDRMTKATAGEAYANKLGDIVASSPMFVGRPPFFYPDNLENQPYSKFRADNVNRKQVIYAGANDGMLHGFNAQTGVEMLAFIPSPAYENLASLASPSYQHKFFVDAPPNMGDVFYDSKWHTVLVGGLGAGGQGIYALDVTDPDDFSEDNAEDLILWEFTDADDADLGYTYSQPAIVRLQDTAGTWVAIFGNGYSNTEADDHVSSTGNSKLYVVNIKTGELIREFDTGAGPATTGDKPNGMSTPAVVDINADNKVDYVYAGDLYGNLWKFDIRDKDPTKWTIQYDDEDGNAAPIFVATNSAGARQPITSRPEVIRGPRGVGMMVLFGTGKYFENGDKIADKSDSQVQSYYGIWDRNTRTNTDIVARSNLIEQAVISEQSVDFEGHTVKIRVTDNKDQGGLGWFMDLVSSEKGKEGERQVSNTVVRAGRVIFTTLVPDEDACESGGSSWLMELDALSGKRLTESPFDNNRDGKFSDGKEGNGHDFVEVTIDGTKVMVAVSGVDLGVGISPEPGILMGEDGTKEYKYNPGTSGSIGVTVENPGPRAAGRQSWRQIR